jgi:RNA polymerase sigma factor (sigma-70 family)
MKDLLEKIGTTPDEVIVESVLTGNVSLFEILIRRYNPLLYKIARSHGFNHQDSEDLMQDTHVSAYQFLAQFEGRASYKTWISKIMVHKCLYKLKYGYHKNETPAESLGNLIQPVHMKENELQPESKMMNRELAIVLEKSLQEIPFIYRSVFVLREVEGFSTAETADLLQITETNVKVRLNRAKALLQKQVKQYYSHSDIYSFNLVYCDAIVYKVFARINAIGEKAINVMGYSYETPVILCFSLKAHQHAARSV